MGLPPPPLISTLNGTAAEVARGVNFAGEDGGRGAIFRLGAVGQQLRLATETLQLLRLEAPDAAGRGRGGGRAVFILSFGTDAYARVLSAGRRPTRRRLSTAAAASPASSPTASPAPSRSCTRPGRGGRR